MLTLFRIVGALTALASFSLQIACPSTASAQVPGQIRVSRMGPDNSDLFEANTPAVAYNARDDEHLVVWSGDDPSIGDNQFEIFGQRISVATGEPADHRFRISDMGPEGDGRYDAITPAVAYNASRNEYLVVWSGRDNSMGAGSRMTGGGGVELRQELDIFGQIIDASGRERRANDFRISRMGPDGDEGFYAKEPAVTHNSEEDEYLVVWSGSDDTGRLVESEYEVYGQRIDAETGREIGDDDFRVSSMGPDGDWNFGAFSPAITFNPDANEYLIAWGGDDDRGELFAGIEEIFVQRIDGRSGREIGADDQLISTVSRRGNYQDAFDPSIAYNSLMSEYFVVWQDNAAGSSDEGDDIFGRRLNGTTAEPLGSREMRISDMGPPNRGDFRALAPSVALSLPARQYLVTWIGNDGVDPMRDTQVEVYAQILNLDGAEIGPNDIQVSAIGPGDDTPLGATNRPWAVFGGSTAGFLVVWEGDRARAGRTTGDREIFARRLITSDAGSGN